MAKDQPSLQWTLVADSLVEDEQGRSLEFRGKLDTVKKCEYHFLKIRPEARERRSLALNGKEGR